MKVLFISPEYPSIRSGGIGTFFRTMGRQLCRLGHEVKILIPGEHEDFEDEGIHVRFVRPSRVPHLGWVLNRMAMQHAIREIVRFGGADVIEAPDWCGLTAGLCVRPPLLIRCHGSDTYFSHILGRRVRRKTYLEEKVAIRAADGVAAVSRYCAERTAHLFRLKTQPQVIHNGVDTSVYRPPQSQPLGQLAVLVVGTLVRKKGCLDLPRIINAIARQIAAVEFRIIGRDSKDTVTGAPSMIELILNGIDPAVRGRVRYFGEQPTDVVRREMGAAAVCLFPSYAEALPISWLEAMACGCPVVGYDAGWAREIIHSGADGFLVPAGDAEGMAKISVELICQDELRREAGRQARRKIERHFTLQACAERTLEWYRAFLE